MFLSAFVARGQYGAKFTVNSHVGCNPFTVVVTDLSGAPDTIPINYDYGDGSPIDSIEFHTYTQPGVYRIIQTVANANPRQDTLYVEVIDQYPPEFYLFNCKGTYGSVIVKDTLYEAFEIDWGDGLTDITTANTLISHNYGVISSFNVTVKGLINGSQSPTDSSNFNCDRTTKALDMILDIQPATIQQVQVLNTNSTSGMIAVEYYLEPNNNYLIEIKSQNDASYTIIDTINQVMNPSTYILQNLNTRDNYYCISITAFDPCDNDTRQSNIGCSINLQTTALNRQNQVDWATSSTDFLSYSIAKDGSVIATIGVQGQMQFLDSLVICGITYEYQVTMRENNGLISISDTSRVTAISTTIPEPIEDITATVSGQDIILTWDTPPNSLATMYIISRSEDGNQYQVIDTVADTGYTDPGLFTQSTRYYYKINYVDACDILSAESITASPVLLIEEADQVISWSAYEGWQNGVSFYTLEKYDENGQLIESVTMGLNTSYTEDPANNPYQYILYRVIATPIDIANGVSESNYLEVIYRSKVAFPNAFSPNGDGTNDIFNFKSRYIRSATMKIFNRWGELIYQTDDMEKGWDGTVDGKYAPPGVYIHHTTLTDDMGITFVKSGEVVLIR